MAQYRFVEKHNDAVVQLPTIKYPVTKDNLTDAIAQKMLKVPSLRHLIEPTNPEARKKLEAKTEGVQVDAFGNPVLDEKIDKVVVDPNNLEAIATADAKEGEVVGVQNSPDDIYVDEREREVATRPSTREVVEEQQPDPNFPRKQENVQPKNVSPVSPKSTGGSKSRK